jgi:predicted nucleic acid-binding protein
MAAFFFDSSALVKLYVNETGTVWVKSLADPVAGNRLYITRIAGVEVISAIARRRSTGALNVNDAATAISDFRRDLVSLYVIIEVDAPLITHAMLLAEAHALRGYDAVQLAAALKAQSQRLASGLLPPTLISADVALNDAAIVEGFNVDDPNDH